MKRSSKDFFESIAEFPHNIGIYLTYTLDSQVIDKLDEYSQGTILVLHDFTQGKNLQYNRDSAILCLPVKTLLPHQQNCFHSKLALLKSDEKAKLIIGSSNLSMNSFLFEKEIAFEKELDFGNSQDMFLYDRILLFLNGLNEQIPVAKNIWLDTLQKLQFNTLKKTSGDIEFVYNSCDDSIFNNIEKFILQNCKGDIPIEIKILTPFISATYPKLEEFKKIASNLSIYLRNGTKIDPFKNDFKIFQPIDKKYRGFHSKVILISYENYSVVFIGSANFSEQGFFQTTNQCANQECGIISKSNPDEMTHWFDDKYWKQITDFELYKETDGNSIESFEKEMEPYAWATKENNVITTYIYNPMQFRTYQDDKLIQLEIVDKQLYIYKTEDLKIKNKEGNMIIFKLGKILISIVVFDYEEFNSQSRINNESIFNSFKGVYSVDPKEVDEAIDKNKISVRVTSSKLNITEPPILEQYFQNVKDLIQKLKRKKYFSEYNVKEVENKLHEFCGGRAMYLTLQLLKIFSLNQNAGNLVNICERKIRDLSSELELDETSLKNL